eukprot:scaffold29286_cov63-Phaeocystis_antarctica.AAC.2
MSQFTKNKLIRRSKITGPAAPGPGGVALSVGQGKLRLGNAQESFLTALATRGCRPSLHLPAH